MRARRARAAVRASGFTLVELLVALVLLALVSGALVAGVRSALGISEAGTHRAEAAQELRLVSDLVRSGLAGMVPVQTVTRGRSERIFHLAGERGRLQFVVDAPARFRVGGLYETVIEQARADGRPAVRWTRQLLHPDLEPSRGGPRAVGGASRTEQTSDERVLVKGAELTLAYFGAPPRTGQARWHERWDGEWGTPALVRVQIRSEADGDWPPIVVRPWVSRPRFRSIASGDADLGPGEEDIEEEPEAEVDLDRLKELGVECIPGQPGCAP